MTEQDLIAVEMYLDGELPAGERTDFEARLRKEPELTAALEDRRELNDLLRAEAGEADFRAMLSEVMRQPAEEKEAKVVAMQPKRGRLIRWLSAAAAVLLALVVSYFVFIRDDFNLANYNDYPAMALVQRGDGKAVLERAESAFNAGNYAQAEDPLREILAAEPGNNQARLGLIIALIETGDFAGARSVYTEMQRDRGDFKDLGTFYMALIAKQEGDVVRAGELLDGISDSNDAYLKAKIDRLRADL